MPPSVVIQASMSALPPDSVSACAGPVKAVNGNVAAAQMSPAVTSNAFFME
jgi:hypothetical protein